MSMTPSGIEPVTFRLVASPYADVDRSLLSLQRQALCSILKQFSSVSETSFCKINFNIIILL
jgi:hypothetical protein